MLRLLAVMLVLLAPLRLAAQETSPSAVLVADELFITPDRVLVASGNVEAFQGDTRLRATSIRYDQATGAMTIEGPIILTEGTRTVIIADAASLDADLRNGILRGARLVLDERLQLAATQIDRVDGRYSQLYQTAITSCRVCDDGRPPLWQIRARRVIHDDLERQLYLENAQFRVGNVPIFYLPRMRLPGPTVERATGILAPSVRTTSQLGIGVKIPYFITLGEHRDLTLTPYVSAKTKTLEFRYRQAFINGNIQFDAAVTRDEIERGKTRGYFFGSGAFDLPSDFNLRFEIETTSDDAYLIDYDYSDADRLKSELTVDRARRDEYIRASLINFRTLRDNEDNDTIPTLVLDGEYERRVFPVSIGGEFRFGLEAHSHYRTSSLATDGPDADDIVDGRDVARLNARAEWLNTTTYRGGLQTDWRFGAAFDIFNISQDASVSQTQYDAVPFAAFTLRYPMARAGKGGSAQVLEPIAQFSWTGGGRLPIPNEESTRVEFDQGDILSMSRFPAPDRREHGSVGALGVNWSRFDPTGWDAHLTVAQVFRDRYDDAFTESSGLRGTSSDLLVAGQITGLNGLALTGRSLLNEDFNMSKTELRGEWDFRRGRLGGSYVWLGNDPDEDRDRNVSEFTLDGNFKVNQFWTASADWHYDTESGRASTAELGLSYKNECVTVDLTVKRRNTSSSSVEPSTDIGFNIGLRGFSAGSGTERYARSCSN
ncbi:LPS-assembly protein LptD [Sulfitobacter sp. SK012]|uniref:LPS-assembly protein LptD n=1 Tax=Sulfitobacter sp. SK012 TaxID=1389005 RepID=UPI0020C80919|nr:LPS assembly protein LptD [Sulfitobacter sp. SK012]